MYISSACDAVIEINIGERFNMQLDDAFKQYAKNGYLVD